MIKTYTSVYLRPRNQPNVRAFPVGGIVDCQEPLEAFKFLEMRKVPDPDHQSSLDYLKGV